MELTPKHTLGDYVVVCVKNERGLFQCVGDARVYDINIHIFIPNQHLSKFDKYKTDIEYKVIAYGKRYDVTETQMFKSEIGAKQFCKTNNETTWRLIDEREQATVMRSQLVSKYRRRAK